MSSRGHGLPGAAAIHLDYFVEPRRGSPRNDTLSRRTNLGRIAAALLVAAMTFPAARAELKPGDPLPASIADAEGLPPTPGRVVLLDFWASWCAPCKASFPAFARLHEEFAARGLVIVAVGIDDKEPAHEAFLKKLKPPFFTMRDAARTIVAEVRPPAMPTSYLFGRDGRLRSIHTGFHGRQTEAELREELDALLNEER